MNIIHNFPLEYSNNIFELNVVVSESSETFGEYPVLRNICASLFQSFIKVMYNGYSFKLKLNIRTEGRSDGRRDKVIYRGASLLKSFCVKLCVT